MATATNPLSLVSATGIDVSVLEDHVEPFQRLATQIPGTDNYEVESRGLKWHVWMNSETPPGDLKSDVPNIVLSGVCDSGSFANTSFTWDEARAVALAILDVTTVADRG